MAAAAARVRQVKTIEKVLLGIRSCSIEKLQQLNSEFVDHQEWLRQTITDTKEHKDALGLVCPRTTRKAAKKGGIMASKKEDAENVDNTGTATTAATTAAPRTVRKGVRRGKTILAEIDANPANDNDMSVFEPEVADSEPAPKGAAGGNKRGKRGKKEEEPEEPKEPEPAAAVEEAKPKAQAKEKPAAKAADKAADDVEKCYKDELTKLKVVEIRAKLNSRGLPTGGAKADLVARLNAAMVSDDFRADASRPKLVVGQDCSPKLGMRVVHSSGPEHGSSGGLYGVIEFIPGRGGAPNEKSVSVRWMSDLSDVRGPYYTGESCDRGSGVGSSKFDLICMDEVEPEVAAPADAEQQQQSSMAIEGLQVDDGEESPSAPSEKEEEQIAAAEDAMQDDDAPAGGDEDAEGGEDADMADAVGEPIQETPKPHGRGQKRASDGSPKESSAPISAKHPVASKAEEQQSSAPSPEPAATSALLQKLGGLKQAWADRDAAGTPVAETPRTESAFASKPLLSTTPAQPVAAPVAAPVNSSTPDANVAPTPSTGSGGGAFRSGGPSVSDSVQQFRAIISRIHSGHNAGDAMASASKPAGASVPRVIPTSSAGSSISHSSSSAQPSSSTSSKPGTWPIPVAPAPIKPAASGRLSTEAPAASSSSSSATTSRIQPLTADTLNAHAQSNPKIDMFRQGGVPKVLEVKTTAPVSDLAARQQRAAENRQRLEDEKKKQAAEQERRRKELEAKRLEVDKVAAERRAAEIKAQNDRLEAARARAQREEEERIAKQVAEQEAARRRHEEEKREERARAVAAAQAAAMPPPSAKPAVPAFGASPAPGGAAGAQGSASKGIFGAIGGALKNVFGGSEQQTAAVKKAEDDAQNSIQIQMEKNSDDSEEEEEEQRKLPPSWARSPLLRAQIDRQADMSPTPIFGECKKTCDLGHIFQNHVPKRRKYDKRTSSADWGDDGRASFMEEDRFQRQMIQNMAMQNAGKSGRL